MSHLLCDKLQIEIFRTRALDKQIQIPEDPFLPARIKGLAIFEHLALLPQLGDNQTCSNLTSCLKSHEAPIYFLCDSCCGAVRNAKKEKIKKKK